MRNAETILEFLERFPTGVCDDCISRETGVEPRQQVYQICRRMEQRRTITRAKARCVLCERTKTVTIIVGGASEPEVAASPRTAKSTAEASTRSRSEVVSIEALRNHLDRFCKVLELTRFGGG